MTAAPTLTWQEANQRYLISALAVVKECLERHVAGDRRPRPPEEDAPLSVPPAALETLAAMFGLSRFERELLVLCAGVELDSSVAGLCGAAQGDERRAYPTFSLALAALAEPHWSALTPAGPLRRWRLVEVTPGGSLTTSPLRIDERVLHYLAGVSFRDERLAGLVEPSRAHGEPPASHQEITERVAQAWSQASKGALPVIQLCGSDVAGKLAIAAAAMKALGLSLHVMPAALVPTAPVDLEALIRLWEREVAMSGCALLVDADEMDTPDTARARALSRLLENTAGPILISARDRRRMVHRPAVVFDVQKPGVAEQRKLWESVLGPAVADTDGRVEALVSQFSLDAPAIRAAASQALVNWTAESEDLGNLLWDACRAQARPRLDDLAQRIPPAARWEDLVLPPLQTSVLRDIAAHVRRRAMVYETWGFAARGARGLGIAALFTGSSGTGKTMAAEVLASELHLDLYRIDLSSVVSKYIGETEKNLRRVFDAAEEGGAILLFDEADALFGKRSEVKDSHDRYANIEVSYLLQRMESYRGLAILTTNMKSALDTAFLRRIRFIVEFPFPAVAERGEIWRRVFPPGVPTEGLDVQRLATLNLAGGNIRNIALHAAFLAADAGEPVRMAHLLRAARGEYAKLEKPLGELEGAAWA